MVVKQVQWLLNKCNNGQVGANKMEGGDYSWYSMVYVQGIFFIDTIMNMIGTNQWEKSDFDPDILRWIKFLLDLVDLRVPDASTCVKLIMDINDCYTDALREKVCRFMQLCKYY